VWTVSGFTLIKKLMYLNLLPRAATSTAGDFCQSETFQPRCFPGEAVIITKAVYGRMSHDSRCLQDEEVLPSLRDDPRHMGCFENVLQLVSARCSGQPACEIRVPDPEMEKTNPCYRYTVKYLEADYQCIRSKSYTFKLKSRLCVHINVIQFSHILLVTLTFTYF